MKGYSTAKALLSLQEELMWSIDKKEQALLICSDLSNAFYMVDHPILIKNMHIYGFGEKKLNWISCYLSHLSEYVQIIDTDSSYDLICIGVPQGSILGLIFYLLMTNDFPSITDNDCNHFEIVAS